MAIDSRPVVQAIAQAPVKTIAPTPVKASTIGLKASSVSPKASDAIGLEGSSQQMASFFILLPSLS